MRASVVIDYQNVYLTGHGIFGADRPRKGSLIDPLLFAERLLNVRNMAQRKGMAHATLSRVLVFRGQPSAAYEPDAYARSLAQKEHWQRDPRVEVNLRPLKYPVEYTAFGKKLVGADGRHVRTGAPREKGVDVLCAIAVIRQAQSEETDLVILASVDTDLQPALDEALSLKTAKIETVNWWQPTIRHSPRLQPSAGRTVWNTRLTEVDWLATHDTTRYSSA